MNIVIPMAGLGERFSHAGFELPKPLIQIHNKPMYRYAVDCMPLSLATNVVFILKESTFSAALEEDINIHYQHLPRYSILTLKETTRGQAETILKAAELLDLHTPTLIHNCDTYIEQDFDWATVIQEEIAGAVVLFPSQEDRWSYARLNKEGTYITEFKEKIVISTHASTGTYYFKDTSELLALIEHSIHNNLRANNEFYLSTIYQMMLQKQQLIKPLWVKQMLCFGTPRDLVDSLNKLLNTRN